LISSAKEICGLKFICTKFEGISPASLRIMGDHIKFTAQDAIALLASVNEEKVSVLVVCGLNALKEGAHAGKIVKEIAAMAGGSGGGRPDSAMGGANPEMIDDALASAAEIVETLLINK
ncbi:MAG: alanine--tRNA ligase, partial [Oscillospiraceae bacterium]|nr:alanine--tRNA ligase [Oscillospiraceae bacterium]